MKKNRVLLVGFIIMVTMSLVLVGCGGSDSNSQTPSNSNQEPAPTPAPGNEDNQAASIGEQVNYEIIGIDPGAGLMAATRDVIEQYGLSDWKLVESSDSAMTAALKRAYSNQQPIIVTGWTPHWKFSSFDLKYLDDPLNIYGGDEQIHTLVRVGLQNDHPSAYQVLDNFLWEPGDMADVMVLIEEGMNEVDAAADWVNNNADKVSAWTDGVDKVDGDKLNLAYVAWASEIASTNVIANVLEQVGYNVTLQQLEAGGMFAGLASGSSDAIVAAWLPTTHEAFYERFQADFEDLGPNLDGTRIGLVVPAYMDIDSIEDLK